MRKEKSDDEKNKKAPNGRAGGLGAAGPLPAPCPKVCEQDTGFCCKRRLLGLLAQQRGLSVFLCHVCEVFLSLPSLETNQFSFKADHVFKKHALEI